MEPFSIMALTGVIGGWISYFHGEENLRINRMVGFFFFVSIILQLPGFFIQLKDISGGYRSFVPEIVIKDDQGHILIEGESGHAEKKQGLWRWFEGEGVLLKEANYKNNKLDGTYKEFYPGTGNLKEKGAYINGEKYGSWISFEEMGIKKTETIYFRNLGFLNGVIDSMQAPRLAYKKIFSDTEEIKADKSTWKYYLGLILGFIVTVISILIVISFFFAEDPVVFIWFISIIVWLVSNLILMIA